MKNHVVFLVCLFLLQGCSAFKSNTQTVSVTCSQPVTLLRINGDSYSCPAKVDVRRNRPYTVEANLDGYRPYSKTVDFHFSTTAKIDVVLIPFTFFSCFGLIFPGAWDLDQTEVNVELYPVEQVKK